MLLPSGNSVTRKIWECCNTVTRQGCEHPINGRSHLKPPFHCRNPCNHSRTSSHVGWWRNSIPGLVWGPVRLGLMERKEGGCAEDETGEVKLQSDPGRSQRSGACNHRNRLGGEGQGEARGKRSWTLEVSFWEWFSMSCPQTAAAPPPLGPHPRATESEALVNNDLFFFFFNKPVGWFWCTFKFENHWSSTVVAHFKIPISGPYPPSNILIRLFWAGIISLPQGFQVFLMCCQRWDPLMWANKRELDWPLLGFPLWFLWGNFHLVPPGTDGWWGEGWLVQKLFPEVLGLSCDFFPLTCPPQSSTGNFKGDDFSLQPRE